MFPTEGSDPASPVDPALPLRLARLRPRVVVLGDAVLDGWLVGRADRVCREGPVPVVDVAGRQLAPGAAGNVAANLAQLGARTSLVCQIGVDGNGRRLVAGLRRAGVDVSGVVISAGCPTPAKIRVAAGDQVVARFDEPRPRPPGADVVHALIERLDAALDGCDALVVADYGLGLLQEPLRDHVAACRDRIPLLVVDAHDCRRWARTRPDLVTPSLQEADRLLSGRLPARGADPLPAVEGYADHLLRLSGGRQVAVTCDRDGVLLLAPRQPPYRTRARAAADSHTSGAGDAFTAAATLARCAGLSWPAAVELGQAAADVVVAEAGPSVCGSERLTARLSRQGAAVIGSAELAAVVAVHRAAGRRIVFTNGCFDVLHRAHVAYLEEARRLGDVLVVAVNSDASVRRLKGPGRPVNAAEDRAAMVAALRWVDHVTVFDEDTPAELLRQLRPEIYAKGGDYSVQMLAEAPVVRSYGGQVRTVGYRPGVSTTALIERIATTRRAPARRASTETATAGTDPDNAEDVPPR